MIVSMAEVKINKKFAELAKLKEKIERQIRNEVAQRTNSGMDRTDWTAKINGGKVSSIVLFPRVALQAVR